MLPSLLARDIAQGLQQFLVTGFDPSDDFPHGLMSRFVADPAGWLKGPYLLVGLPFALGAKGRGFFAGFDTEFRGYSHQEAAWQRLSSLHAAASTLVATGKGSGKTECFLYLLAGWVAGELFRRAAGAPDPLTGWSDKAASAAFHAATKEMDSGFPTLSQSLRGIGLTGKKVLPEFMRWAKNDADLPPSETELSEVLEWQRQFGGRASSLTASQALLERADEWMDRRSPRWLMGWRDICRSTDYRTLIASVLPRAAVNDKFLLMTPIAPAPKVAALLGCLNSLTCDYIARQKVGGNALKYFTVKQLAVLPPDRYTEKDLGFIVPRVLELTYTANDLGSWAYDLGYTGAPFIWDADRRARLRAELDAYYARLYGLDRDDLRFILDPQDVAGEGYPSETFRVMKANERRAFAEYRTRRLVLESWDAQVGMGH